MHGLDNVRRVSTQRRAFCSLFIVVLSTARVCLVRKNVVITAEHSDATPPIIAISRCTNRSTRKRTDSITSHRGNDRKSVTDPNVRVLFHICIEKHQLRRQNGRWRHTRELERKEAVRARIFVTFLPACVFPDRWTRRLVIVHTAESEFAMERCSFVLTRRSCLYYVCSSDTVRHRHGVSL